MPLDDDVYKTPLTMAGKISVFKRFTAHNFRHLRANFINNCPQQFENYSLEILDHAGWHFSYIGDRRFNQNKLLSFSHSAEYTRESIKNFDLNSQVYNNHRTFVKVDNYFPRTILNNLKKYQQHIVDGSNVTMKDLFTQAGYQMMLPTSMIPAERVHAVQQLYRSLLRRDADEEGLKNYANSEMSPADIEQSLKNSNEYRILMREEAIRTEVNDIMCAYDESHNDLSTQNTIHKIHQIYISDGNTPPGKWVADKMQKLKNLYSDYEYTLYNDDMCRNEIRTLLGERGVKAYDSLNAYAFKADLARYCILYQHGGLYFDSVICPERKIEVQEFPMMYRAPKLYWISDQHPLIENGVMLFPVAKHPFIRDAIIACLENIEMRTYSKGQLGITGPSMLGELDTRDIQLGQSQCLSPEQQSMYGTQKAAFFDKELHWLYKPNGTILTDSFYECAGTNSYERLWETRQIFKQQPTKFISFYTEDYTEHAEFLKKSLEYHGLDTSNVEYRERAGTWEANTQIKATFILEKLLESDSVIWTDADSRVLQTPSFFDDIDTDVALFFLPKELSRDFVLPAHSILKNVDSYLQSGTMYFKNNDRVIDLLERWIELNQQDPMQWDQWTLQVALQNSDVTITELPPEYIWAFFIAEVYPGRIPVIEHYQASKKNESIVR
jgi:mannosyltransferase OCH1-like enzyme